MKHISEINTGSCTMAAASAKDKTNDFVKRVIDRLFKQLETIFPAYSHAMPTEEVVNKAKREWVKAFIENDISTVEQIQEGLTEARRCKSDFMPSCGKFVAWCVPAPSTKGFPSVDDALQSCIRYRVERRMNDAVPVRPVIQELTKLIDWWAMDHALTMYQRKHAEECFKERYSELLASGYVEPEATQHDRLPTREAVDAGMTDKQKADKKQRDMKAISGMREKLK